MGKRSEKNLKRKKAGGSVTKSGHDPRIVELVRIMARKAAERDYSENIMSNNESLREVPDND